MKIRNPISVFSFFLLLVFILGSCEWFAEPVRDNELDPAAGATPLEPPGGIIIKPTLTTLEISWDAVAGALNYSLFFDFSDVVAADGVPANVIEPVEGTGYSLDTSGENYGTVYYIWIAANSGVAGGYGPLQVAASQAEGLEDPTFSDDGNDSEDGCYHYIDANELNSEALDISLTPSDGILAGGTANEITDINRCLLVGLDTNGDLSTGIFGFTTLTNSTGVSGAPAAVTGVHHYNGESYALGYEGRQPSGYDLLFYGINGWRDALAGDYFPNTLLMFTGSKFFFGGEYIPPGGGDTTAVLRRYDFTGVTLSNDAGFSTTSDLTYATFRSWVTKLIPHPDGKLIAVGTYKEANMFVEKVNVDGTMDTGFNGTGRYIETETSKALDVWVQPGGKILVAGQRNGQAAIWRFNSDGTLDSTFGIAGIYFTTENITLVTVIRTAPDGKIFVAGTNGVPGDPCHLFRLDADGQNRDLTFGDSAGLVSFYRGINDMEIQSDGRLILAGQAHPVYSDFAVWAVK